MFLCLCLPHWKSCCAFAAVLHRYLSSCWCMAMNLLWTPSSKSWDGVLIASSKEIFQQQTGLEWSTWLAVSWVVLFCVCAWQQKQWCLNVCICLWLFFALPLQKVQLWQWRFLEGWKAPVWWLESCLGVSARRFGFLCSIIGVAQVEFEGRWLPSL